MPASPLLEVLVEAARAVAERKAREADERRATMRRVKRANADEPGEAA